jgi:hypothetical protein
MTIQDVERQLEQLSRDEKALVFQRLALDLVQSWPGVEKTPGVQGGDACIVRTRIPVWTLEATDGSGGMTSVSSQIFPRSGKPTSSMPGSTRSPTRWRSRRLSVSKRRPDAWQTSTRTRTFLSRW